MVGDAVDVTFFIASKKLTAIVTNGLCDRVVWAWVALLRPDGVNDLKVKQEKVTAYYVTTSPKLALSIVRLTVIYCVSVALDGSPQLIAELFVVAAHPVAGAVRFWLIVRRPVQDLSDLL